ncbi:MBL fold metallo-hydrolase [Aquabacter spiritensis]|uniref:Glyoxylase-like metal-dependent hydrolase (Beta-lactamase superfamily II) n=1 Tax=Aquabacter spiritensis TaxID=933073 RepID=A0A4R3LZV3_9HYPH|nr:MBL fold metallo-hydrolase [Aquabacter spiritensis]TCT04327.1 glyoxylase-like metal-dependent hydrolase (beta-lactamase superfamily II) [Aquabacter spiritensis]
MSQSSPPLQIAVVPVTPFQQNCSILWCTATNAGAVIDPGGDLDRIESAIAETGVRIEKILLTHGHVDHAAGAGALAERLGVPIEGPHRADQPLLDALPEVAAQYGFPPARAVTPDRYLAEGETVSVGDLSLDVLEVPGHTPGHVVLVHRPSRVALVGDTLFKGSVGRTDFPYGDHDLLIAGIVGKLLPLGDAMVCLPGHGPVTSIGDERANNPFLPR